MKKDEKSQFEAIPWTHHVLLMEKIKEKEIHYDSRKYKKTPSPRVERTARLIVTRKLNFIALKISENPFPRFQILVLVFAFLNKKICGFIL